MRSPIPIDRKSAACRPRRFTLAEKAMARLWPYDRRFADSISAARISSTDERRGGHFGERFWRGIGQKLRTRQCALFLTSTTDERVIKQFKRLRAQAQDHVDVYLVVNSSPLPVVASPDAEELMPLRFAAMMANGFMVPGYVDLIWMPLGLAAPYPYVWMIEFDVDYAGDWGQFFAQFRRNRADLLTTSLTRLVDDPGWDHWETIRAPATVDAADWRRDFHPIMRLSQRFMRAYVSQMRSPDWAGHHEFTISHARDAFGHASRRYWRWRNQLYQHSARSRSRSRIVYLSTGKDRLFPRAPGDVRPASVALSSREAGLGPGLGSVRRVIAATVGQPLAAFKTPRKILVLAEIPKGATGKLQRIGLAQKLGLG